MHASIRQVGWIALALVGAAATFVLTTVVMDQVPDALVIATALIGAFVVAAAAQGTVAIAADVRAAPGVWRLAGDGVLAFWAPPLLALSQRATDSPSGSDAVMLMTALWGMLAVLAAFVYLRRGKGPYVLPAGAMAALVGAAAILANWERPSSLNLFVRAADREAMMVFAALVFAIGSVRLASGIRRVGPKQSIVVALGGATAVAVLFALPSVPGALSSVGRAAPMLALLGLAYGLFCVGWTRACASGGVESAAVSLLLVPVGLTGLSALERAVGVFGPNPLVWVGVTAGTILCLGAGATILSSSGNSLHPPVDGTPAVQRRVPRWATVIGVAAVVLAIAALFLPSIQATSEGSLGGGFRATWQMLGFETAGGWWPLAASLLALAALVDIGGGSKRSSSVVGAIAALTTVFTASASSNSPLHTWTSWIPPDVQQTYGTEYARLVTEPLVSPTAVLSLGFAAVTALITLVLAYRARRGLPGDDVIEEGS